MICRIRFRVKEKENEKIERKIRSDESINRLTNFNEKKVKVFSNYGKKLYFSAGQTVVQSSPGTLFYSLMPVFLSIRKMATSQMVLSISL